MEYGCRRAKSKAPLGLLKRRTRLKACRADRQGTLHARPSRLSLQARTRQLSQSQGHPSAAAVCQPKRARRILYPSGSAEQDRINHKHPPFAVSLLQELQFFIPLPSRVCQSFIFGKYVPHRPSRFPGGRRPSQPLLRLAASQGNKMDSLCFCCLPFLTFPNSFR